MTFFSPFETEAEKAEKNDVITQTLSTMNITFSSEKRSSEEALRNGFILVATKALLSYRETNEKTSSQTLRRKLTFVTNAAKAILKQAKKEGFTGFTFS